ncbi:MAG: DUF5107 domain-containing protein [Arachnia sp.]
MLTDESTIILPDPPAALAQRPVAAWNEPVLIDTYDVAPPSKYPAYLDRRVYQGSSGRVYPLPFYERIASTKQPRAWQAIHLENEFVKLVILPELGGRIAIGMDKTNGYDFFYRNNVIKPALVGVTGPWLSGGVEFNWPQHHRPATYLPVTTAIEEAEDGSVTVWCSDLDPFHRMRGTHGVRLSPGSSVVELLVRLTNRTTIPQTFLWWANVAAKVGPDYQSFFPTDVHFVADHAKRAVVSFPEARGDYYGVDYPGRVGPEHPDADRIDWYRNIPVPTSYMCLGSQDDFFGGYDHGKHAGFVHHADHRIAPGKKQWTWGNAPFGWAWDRNLTDGDGPYVELMAGVYTDNQPDFSFLAPGETKTFTQNWYPIREIGVVHQATTEAAIHLDVAEDHASVGIAVTRTIAGTVRVWAETELVHHAPAELDPAHPLHLRLEIPQHTPPQRVRVELTEADATILTWQPRPAPDYVEVPPAATEPPAPADVATTEELYQIGLHLRQYRHATRRPETYWDEALRRDPSDIRCLTAYATAEHARGLLASAGARLRHAIERLTRWNPNPYDGEPFYRLGLVLQDQNRPEEAYDYFAKAAWNEAWRRPSWLAMARIDAAAGRWASADDVSARLIAVDPANAQAAAVRAIVLRALNRDDAATAVLDAARAIHPIDAWLSDLRGEELAVDPATLIDVADEYSSCGQWDAALRVLDSAWERETTAPVPGMGNQAPLIALRRADVMVRGDIEDAERVLDEALTVDHTGCFPGRLADALLLDRTRQRRRAAPMPAALMGHWLYAVDRGDVAISQWLDAGEDVVCLRNRGVAAFNTLGDPDEAIRCYDAALALAGPDAKLAYERDQLAKATGEAVAARLERLSTRADLVAQRDDLRLEYATLLTASGRAAEAVELLVSRHFQPWEGGEGVALAAWEQAHSVLARDALAAGEAAAAVDFAAAALKPPVSLGEDRHPLANIAQLELGLGDALSAAGREEEARAAWERAARAQGDFVAMATQRFSPRSYSSLIAMQRLGRADQARQQAEDMLVWATALRRAPASIDYFATSLPSLLLFHTDIKAAQDDTALLIQAQACAVLGRVPEARAMAEEVLGHDPSLSAARDLLRSIGSVGG